MENDEQVAVATITDEELELDLTPDGTEDAEALKEKLTKAETAKRQILARAKKAEEENKLLKAKPHIKEETPTKESNIEDQVWTIAEMIREGYTREDVDFIMKNGGREALKNESSYVAVALRSKMEQRRAEQASSQTSVSTGGSEVERKYTTEQLKNMSRAELEKILPQA